MNETNETKETKGLAFNGYVYELAEYIPPPLWIKADSDFWDIVMVSPASEDKRAVQELGVRTIDRTRCMVFLCADGKIRALTMVAARAAKQNNQTEEELT